MHGWEWRRKQKGDSNQSIDRWTVITMHMHGERESQEATKNLIIDELL